MYPIFARLKQLSKAIAMAQWIWLNEIPIDISQVKELVDKQRVRNYNPIVPSLKMERTKESVNGNTTIV